MTNTTRLVVLGAVRQFQPVHGYFLRRELSSWHVDEWANIRPGSIYNALRTLQKDGYVEEIATLLEGNRPAKTTYRLTAEGDTEFHRLLRRALWDIESFDAQPLMAAASFMCSLSREEVTRAFEHRVERVDAAIAENSYHIEDSARSSTTPEYVREIFELSNARLRGERSWSAELLDRLKAGDYSFADEPGTMKSRSRP